MSDIKQAMKAGVVSLSSRGPGVEEGAKRIASVRAFLGSGEIFDSAAPSPTPFCRTDTTTSRRSP
jgi:hypothetical protein